MLGAVRAGKSLISDPAARARMSRRLLGRYADELTSCVNPMETNGGSED
jgi:hypothetical protein